MATPQQLAVLQSYYEAALASQHIFPAYAACEAVLESAWGTSVLAAEYNNLFGQKCAMLGGEPNPPAGLLTVKMPTREVIQGTSIIVQAYFLWFPSISDSFTHRMALLQGASIKYPNYAAALHADNGADFVTLVSKTWSTDPNRAKNVIEIHDAHASLFTVATEAS